MKSLNIKNVLVPVDFSPMSMRAIDSAKWLTSRFGADLHLVHVRESYYPLGFSPEPIGLPAAIPDSFVTISQDIEQRLLRDLQGLGAISGVPANHCHIRHGAPVFDEICRCAREVGADLIVTPTHGRGGLKHIFLGSTAERLVQHSTDPVLVTRERISKGLSNRSTAVMDRLLVPIDFSRRSLTGLRFAIQLAKKLGATITVLHVVDFGSALTSDGYAMYDLARYREIARKEAEKEMSRFLRQVKFGGVKFNSKVVADLFLDALNSTIRTENVDLVVATTHGRTGLKHFVLGSVAEVIVRRAICPVLIVPSHPLERREVLATAGRRSQTTTRGNPSPVAPPRQTGFMPPVNNRSRKINQHPFPERRLTNKFRETHQLISK
jgi:nucleotide-binding universal stress UspA family protein